MSATNFKTENNTLRKLIGNGLTYTIPRFQRDYSWSSEQWEDLWADIMSTIEENENPSHYMGYLVLQSADDKSFGVIDGQQRLTTTTLIILAILKNIQRLIDAGVEAEANMRRLNQIRQTYIGYLDPVTLISHSKLTLNRNNNSYFQDYIIPLGHLPQRGFSASEHLLRKAFEWFDKQIIDYIKDKTENQGQLLARFVEDISDRLFFTVITVSDELNAYKVFETLNSRGVRLSSTDLLKNYLFSILDRENYNSNELKILEDRWEKIVNRLQSEKFPEFLRIYWNSRHKSSRQIDLFKTIKNHVKDRQKVFELIRGMEEDLDNYLSLSFPELSSWSQEDKKCATLLKIFRIKQPLSLLLAAKRQLAENDFSSLLKAITIISFRYNVIGGYSPSEQERVYNNISEGIGQKNITHLRQIWDILRQIYIDDRRFEADFAEKTITTIDSRNKKIVKFILCEIEFYLSGNVYDFSSDSFNIEHILPQNALDNWGGFTNEEINNLTYRLGNMTLLKSTINRSIGNLEYAEKRKELIQSGFKMTADLAENYDSWNARNIASWQRQLSRYAKTIWRVSQLG